MKRCAALLVKGNWVIYENITIGDAYRLRNCGAVIMRQLVHCTGKQIHKQWVTDSGMVVMERIDNV
jgi:hypothetical protein